ncbi:MULTISPECIES: benzylsuccinate synthase gamma subunit family protein [Desulfobacula]|uniref:BssC3: benzylsuccinate synthase, gamma subunit n=2 Tax=Desulfobacula TaxID=28222 RepID=K0NIT0_DESTT|nr:MULTISPECIES: benzylsuccinate synthase gamma subunit family protein [Desulfobacula]CCK79723.1 BssC3: benzylsuccinate synthase, gamma subunit [Desulfobacula toluolica Tol2]SDU59425.1 benzylsuccinate synthase [Desulfobacula phenolica]
MSKCKKCAFFFPIPEGDMDFEPKKGDCIRQQEDTKGKFWLSRPVFKDNTACEHLRARTN